MKIDIHEEKKLVLVWKSTSEKDVPIPLEIKEQLDEYRHKKYRVIIMFSGHEDLYEITLPLLLDNRMKKAMEESVSEYECSKKAV